MQIARTAESLQEMLAEQALDGKSVALVPTMGALHQGHMSLIKMAKNEADTVLVSIFVNPAQFGPNEDFAKYPRMFDADASKAELAGAKILYAPEPEDIYPEGFSSFISVGELSRILEGKSRPGHFDGVATVVLKLLLRTLPHVAIFGEKDYQQLCVIRRAVADFDIPVEIIGAPTLRESDGLAMSSRNIYLSEQERAIAPKLYATLTEVSAKLASGIQPALDQGVAALTAAGFKVDYLAFCDAETLAPLDTLGAPARLLVAAQLGMTRLIDNIAVGNDE